MEELLRQECLAESQVETYKSQLALVDQQLEGASETDVADLKQLREDLSQLIALTEEGLMDVKKQRLLLSLQGLDSHSADRGGGSVGGESRGEEAEGEEEEEREVKRDDGQSGGVEDDNELQGIKCRAPLEEAWGAVNYHNAVILGKENRVLDEKDVKVRVLFTHPTHNAMKPCSYYLEGNCKFDDQTCKFSHGHVVPFSGLLTYQEPDYSLACIGGKCIAKYTDDLWYPGIISSFDETFIIHFTTLNSTIQTSLENVVPLESSESSESSASSENEEDEDEGEGEGEGGVRVLEWTPTGAQRALGEWEKYTTGIGSRLLAKMGYVVGKGLGRDGEGRIEPVEIKILPAGKSLDVCAEMREAGKIRKAPGEVGKGRRRRRKKRKLVDVSGLEEVKEEKVNIFDFLNAKLKKTQTDPTGMDERRSSGSGSGNLNVQLFTVQEEIKSVLRRRHSLMAQLARHKGRDKTMEAHVTEKLAAADKQLERLQREEKSVEKKIALKTERKRLRIF